MKIIDIFIKHGQGFITSGNILLIMLGMIIIGIGFLIAIIAYIFKIGFKVFVIFLDESLFFSIKGHDALKQNITLLQTLLLLLYFYLIKFIVPLLPNITIPSKPTLPKKLIISIIWNILKSTFYYFISLIIVIISIYWVLTYIEIICKVCDILLSTISIKYSIIELLNVLFNKTEIFVYTKTGLKIFNVIFIWLIRLIGFASIFYYRFYRLRKLYNTMALYMILPFKSRFTNIYWSSQSRVQVKYKWIFSILFLVFITGAIIYSSLFLSVDAVNQSYSIPNEKRDIEIQTQKDTIRLKDGEFNIKLNKSTLIRYINNAIGAVEVHEYDHAVKILDDAINSTSLPSDLKRQIIKARDFIRANDRYKALKTLTQIRNQ